MKFLVPNYSWPHNPWPGGYRLQIPVLSVLNWICWTPQNKIPGYATDSIQDCHGKSSIQQEEEESFHQQIGLAFMEERIKVQHLECSFVRRWGFDTLVSRSETNLYKVVYSVNTQQYTTISTVILYIHLGHIMATCFNRKRSSSGQ